MVVDWHPCVVCGLMLQPHEAIKLEAGERMCKRENWEECRARDDARYETRRANA